MSQVLAVFAELERRLIGERTKSTLVVQHAQEVRLGGPPKALGRRFRTDRGRSCFDQGGGTWPSGDRDLGTLYQVLGEKPESARWVS